MDRTVERRRISVSFWKTTLRTISDKQSEKIRVWWNRNCYFLLLTTMKRRWFVADWCIEALLTVGSSSSRPLINWRQTWSTRLLSVTWWRASSTPGLSTVQSSVNWQCRHSGHSGHSNPKYYIATYVSKINWLIWKLDLIFTEFWTLVVFPRSARNVNREWR